MSFRTRHKTRNGKSVYAVRNKKGQIIDIQNISRSIRQDSSRLAKNVPTKPNQGHLGDYHVNGIVVKNLKAKKKLY